MDGREKNFVGQYLKIQREKTGKTIREMSQELGIRPIELSDIEKGNKLPSAELLGNIKSHYGIENDEPIDFLLDREEKVQRASSGQTYSKMTICYARDKKLE